MKIISIIFVAFLFVGLLAPVNSLSNPDSIEDNWFYLVPNYTLEKSDLNKDGYSDIVVANNQSDGSHFDINSYVYWGSATGYSASNRTELPTHGTDSVSIADLNKDGWPDIVFSNNHDDSYNYNINSYIYWGSSSGYSSSNKTELPTNAAIGVAVSDLNNDGWADIIFCNHQNGSGNESTNSYIYWGSTTGYSASSRKEIATVGVYGVTVSDLNKDSYPDIIFTNHIDNSNYFNINSYIYWGSSDYNYLSKTELATKGAVGVSVSDLNKDGWSDLVFANQYQDGSPHYNTTSYIYWGSLSGFSSSNRKELITHGAIGVSVADLNNDSWDDIVFANYYDDAINSHNISSYIYWGSSSSDYSTKTDLPTLGAYGVTISDLNNDGYLDIVFGNWYNGSYTLNSYIYWGSSDFLYSSKSEIPTLGANSILAVMQTYNFVPPPPPPPPPNDKPKVNIVDKVVKARMNHLSRLISEIESKIGPNPSNELVDKINQVKNLIDEAKKAASPAKANDLLNQAKDILNEIIKSLR